MTLASFVVAAAAALSFTQEGDVWKARVRVAPKGRTYLLFWLSGHVAAAEKYMALACEALKVKLPDVQKWLPIVAAAESSRDQTPKNHELLLHWASVVDIE